MAKTFKIYQNGEYSADFLKLLDKQTNARKRLSKIEEEYEKEIEPLYIRKANRQNRVLKNMSKTDEQLKLVCKHVRIMVEVDSFEGSYYDRGYDNIVKRCADCGHVFETRREMGGYG